MKNKVSLKTIIFSVIILISIIFYNKFIYLAPNLNVSIGLIIYAFSFLLLVYLYKDNGIKYAKEAIYATFIIIYLFYLIMVILNSIDGITNCNLVSNALREVFTPNAVNIKGFFLYYPDLPLIITFPVIFFISHFIFISTYEAIEETINYIIGFILSILISFILDQVLFTPLLNAHKLIEGVMPYKDLIKQMTANFIVVIFMSILLLFVYALRKEKRNHY